jgi:hypothetical protein
LLASDNYHETCRTVSMFPGRELLGRPSASNTGNQGTEPAPKISGIMPPRMS